MIYILKMATFVYFYHMEKKLKLSAYWVMKDILCEIGKPILIVILLSTIAIITMYECFLTLIELNSNEKLIYFIKKQFIFCLQFKIIIVKKFNNKRKIIKILRIIYILKKCNNVLRYLHWDQKFHNGYRRLIIHATKWQNIHFLNLIHGVIMILNVDFFCYVRFFWYFRYNFFQNNKKKSR